MFKYVENVTEIAQRIIKNYCSNLEIAVDCTLGNGFDSDFLKDKFYKVYSFDIQKEATDKYKAFNYSNVEVINDSHENILNYINEPIDCAMYNLGYLPGGDKTLTTTGESTIKSIEYTLSLLKNEGVITICLYPGHEEGRNESNKVKDYLSNLDKSKYAVMEHRCINRSFTAPFLIIIEKK